MALAAANSLGNFWVENTGTESRAITSMKLPSDYQVGRRLSQHLLMKGVKQPQGHLNKEQKPNDNIA